MNVPPTIIRQVEDKILETYIRAQILFGRPFELPSIHFDLRGLCAGRARYRDNLIRLNSLLLCENTEEFISRTVPHEVAHLLNNALNGRVRPHGPEWKTIMCALGLNPIRCHNYKVEHTITQRQRRHTYYCACQTHWISQTVHNRMRRGFVYSCSRCGAQITPIRSRLTPDDSTIVLPATDHQ
jgi:SprT protein